MSDRVIDTTPEQVGKILKLMKDEDRWKTATLIKWLNKNGCRTELVIEDERWVDLRVRANEEDNGLTETEIHYVLDTLSSPMYRVCFDNGWFVFKMLYRKD
jgi:hypothetical protein